MHLRRDPVGPYMTMVDHTGPYKTMVDQTGYIQPFDLIENSPGK